MAVVTVAWSLRIEKIVLIGGSVLRIGKSIVRVTHCSSSTANSWQVAAIERILVFHICAIF